MDQRDDALLAARRKFLKSCGKFAVVTPPAVTLMLSAASHGYASALSGRHRSVLGTSGDSDSRSSGGKLAPKRGDRGDDHDR